ncbi:MAG: site-specific integrase [Paludibacteraceae bacterium]|nr:site-specific integrase [Paludibacteraceae bacterium]
MKTREHIKTPTFLDFFLFVEQKRKVSEKLAFSTVKNWNNAYAKLDMFLKSINKQGIKINKVTKGLIDSFCIWLTSCKTSLRKPKQIKNSTANLTLSKVTTVLRVAVEENYVPAAVVQHCPHLRNGPKEAVCLTDMEIEKVVRSDYDIKYVSLAFQFQLLTGLRIGDVCRLRKADIDGKEFIEIVQQKVKRTVVVPITSDLKLLIGKLEHEYPDGEALFPNLRHNEDKLNRHLKIWFQSLGIAREKAHTHIARHSFACRLLRKNVSIYTVSKLLGHASIRTCEKYYANIDKDTLRQALNSTTSKTNESYYDESQRISSSNSASNRCKTLLEVLLSALSDDAWQQIEKTLVDVNKVEPRLQRLEQLVL